MGGLEQTYSVCYQKYYRNRRRLEITIQVPEKSTKTAIEMELKKAISNIGMKMDDLGKIRLLEVKLLKENKLDA